MMSFIEEEQQYWQHILKNCGYEVDDVVLNPSSRKELGDYQYNGAMQLASIYHQNPREIANNIIGALTKDDRYENVNVAGPGFINFSFKSQSLVDYFNRLNSNIEWNYYNNAKKTIFFDYGGANVAKALHVGHLRSANIGEALKRLASALGYKTYSDAHFGDWGRPIGLVMLEIKKRYPTLPFFDEKFQGEYPKTLPIDNNDLIKIYPLASTKAKEDAAYLEEARLITAKFQDGEPGYTALWHAIMNISKTDITRVYKRLNTTFDILEGESDGNRYIPEMNEYLFNRGVVKDSYGAKVIFVNKEDDDHEIPPLLLVKSNGTASYETTDLACIWERMKIWKPDEIWYLADNRQALHFEQVFRAARKSEMVKPETKLEFIPFGTMNGSDGTPFKTRDGGVMALEELLDMVVSECEKKIMPSIVGEERKQIAETVGIATVKYADLIPFRGKDYNFDPVKFSDLQGKTGPYLLYSTIRMKSLLTKAQEAGIKYSKYHQVTTPIEKEIILLTTTLRSTIIKSFTSKSLNDITDYLYKITNLYNNFYSSNKVLIEEDINKKESWLVLTKIIYENNIKLLNILGIEIPNKM